MHALRVLVFAAVLLAGCGSDSPPSAAPPQSPGPDPGASPTTAQPSPQPQPQPEPQPGQDRFVDVERLDSNAECDALVPSRIPAPVPARLDPPPTDGGCGRAVSDGIGHVAAAVRFGGGFVEWLAFDASGRALQRFVTHHDLAIALPEGWQGVNASSTSIPTTVDLHTFFADGSPRNTAQPRPTDFGARSWGVAPDPLGGSVVVQWGPTGSPQEPTCLGDARRYDAQGTPSGAPGRTGCFVMGIGVSNAGETLVLERLGSDRTLIRWLRVDGTSARPPADEPRSFTAMQLLPLLDGSLVAMQGTLYARRYARLAAASDAAPAWLSAHTGQSFRFTRGNKGYAFFPPPGQSSSDCTQVVELVAPSGRRCAKLTFRRDGNACVTGWIDQGWDGTVVQQTGSSACGWRFWPGLLGG